MYRGAAAERDRHTWCLHCGNGFMGVSPHQGNLGTVRALCLEPLLATLLFRAKKLKTSQVSFSK